MEHQAGDNCFMALSKTNPGNNSLLNVDLEFYD